MERFYEQDFPTVRTLEEGKLRHRTLRLGTKPVVHTCRRWTARNKEQQLGAKGSTAKLECNAVSTGSKHPAVEPCGRLGIRSREVVCTAIYIYAFCPLMPVFSSRLLEGLLVQLSHCTSGSGQSPVTMEMICRWSGGPESGDSEAHSRG